jgi:hypothetical protein
MSRDQKPTSRQDRQVRKGSELDSVGAQLAETGCWEPGRPRPPICSNLRPKKGVINSYFHPLQPISKTSAPVTPEKILAVLATNKRDLGFGVQGRKGGAASPRAPGASANQYRSGSSGRFALPMTHIPASGRAIPTHPMVGRAER